MVDPNRIKESGVREGLKINFHPSSPTAPSCTGTALALGTIIGYGTASVSKMPPLDLSPALPRALFWRWVGDRNRQWFMYSVALDMWAVSGIMAVQRQKRDCSLFYKRGIKTQRLSDLAHAVLLSPRKQALVCGPVHMGQLMLTLPMFWQTNLDG